MTNIFGYILLAVLWLIMLLIIIKENTGEYADAFESADHIGIWIIFGILGVISCLFF